MKDRSRCRSCLCFYHHRLKKQKSPAARRLVDQDLILKKHLGSFQSRSGGPECARIKPSTECWMFVSTSYRESKMTISEKCSKYNRRKESLQHLQIFLESSFSLLVLSPASYSFLPLWTKKKQATGSRSSLKRSTGGQLVAGRVQHPFCGKNDDPTIIFRYTNWKPYNEFLELLILILTNKNNKLWLGKVQQRLHGKKVGCPFPLGTLLQAKASLFTLDSCYYRRLLVPCCWRSQSSLVGFPLSTVDAEQKSGEKVQSHRLDVFVSTRQYNGKNLLKACRISEPSTVVLVKTRWVSNLHAVDSVWRLATQPSD